MSLDATVLKCVKHEPSDGRPPIQYRIQLVDESLIEEATSLIIKYFFPRENLYLSIDERFSKPGTEYPSSRMTRYLSEGISLAAILEDNQGNRGALIGCNVLYLNENGAPKKQEVDQPNTLINVPQRTKIIRKTLADLEAKADIFALYGCASFINDNGLTVAAEYEGLGIGYELLRAREAICRMTNTSVFATIFTGAASQHIAVKCGYETLAELDLTTWRFDGQIVYPKPRWPVIKWMAKRYF